MRFSLAFLAILVLATPVVALEEPMFTYRNYGYVVVENGWVIEFRVGFREPLVPGKVATVDVVLEVKEAMEGSTLSIVSVTASTGNVSTSSYVGVFKKAGDRKSLSLSLELSEPRYAQLKPGDHVVEFLSFTIAGYVENATSRSFFTRHIKVPAIIASPAGALKLLIEAPASVEVGASISLNILLSNRGANTIYHVSLSLYVNESLLDVVYYPLIEPGSTKQISINFKPGRGGVYVLTAKARYVTQELSALNLTYQALIYAKTRHYISIAPTTVDGEARLIGVVSPVTDVKVYIEVSLDGLSWTSIATVSPGSDGMFTIPVKTGERKYVLLRARIPDTERTFESISNIVVLENTTQTQVKPPVEVRTVTYTVTQTMVQTVYTSLTSIGTERGYFTSTTQGTPLLVIAGTLMAGVMVGFILLILFRRR